jgi:transcription factor EC
MPLAEHEPMSPDSDAGCAGNPFTNLLALGKKDGAEKWHVCSMAGYKVCHEY